MTKRFFDIPIYQDDINTMLDKNNIRQLLEYERYCRDNAMFDEQKECYSKYGSRVRITWYDGDGREFVEKSKELAKKQKDGLYRSPKHKIYNTFIWINGDKAVAEMQTMMGAIEIVDEKEYLRNGWARLLYKVQKEEGIWKIKGLDCIYERDTIAPVIASKEGLLDEKEFSKYRPSYQCISWVFEKNGMPCNQDLPGDDKLDTVQKLYDETNKWLDN